MKPPMKPEYREWMAQNPFGPGQCREATEAMQAAFPELRRVRGHVYLWNTDKQPPHWWLVDTEGEVVDPTAHQFPTLLGYEPHDESRGEPVGMCAECGGYIYPTDGWSDTTTCSERCFESYTRYCMDPYWA